MKQLERHKEYSEMLIHCFCLSLDVLSILQGVCSNSIWIFFFKQAYTRIWMAWNSLQVNNSAGVGIIFKLRKKVHVAVFYI